MPFLKRVKVILSDKIGILISNRLRMIDSDSFQVGHQTSFKTDLLVWFCFVPLVTLVEDLSISAFSFYSYSWESDAQSQEPYDSARLRIIETASLFGFFPLILSIIKKPGILAFVKKPPLDERKYC